MSPTTPSEDRRNPPGLLLIGHGTRHQAGQQEFLQTVGLVRKRLPQTTVEPAFLELCQPDVGAAVGCMAASGVCRVVAEPVLLLAAAHARRDIPEQLREASRRHSQLQVEQAPHLGCHDAILRLSAQKYCEAMRQSDDARQPIAAEATALLMVGRGTSDAQAIEELHEFVRLRVERTPVAKVLTCFLAVARPTLREALAEAAGSSVRSVIVQPHLLFQGDLLMRLREEVAAAQREFPDKIWRLAGHLGPDALLVEAIAARYLETAARV